MDTLIRQIAQSFENSDLSERSEALGKAMKEVVFSGMNRCGFFKTFVYLPDFDRMEKGTLYTCFLCCEKGAENDPDPYLPYIADELNAMGVPAVPVKTKDGFRIEPVPEPEGEKAALEVFIWQKELRNPDIRICYKQVPLPYEYRCTDDLKETVRAELRKALGNCIKAENTAEKKKKGPKKAQSEKKKAENPGEKWIQPSLFDF